MRALLARRFGYRIRVFARLHWLALRGEVMGVSRARAIVGALSGGVIPLFEGGGPDLTMTTGAAVTAGRIVEVNGDRTIRHGQATTRKALGVVKQTSDAVGDKVAVATSGVWMLRAQGAIAAGDEVIVSAGNDGRVAPLAAAAAAAAADINNARAIVGLALAAINDGADGPVLLRGLS